MHYGKGWAELLKFLTSCYFKDCLQENCDFNRRVHQLVAATLVLLNRRAGDRPIRTEHAAITRLRAQQRAADAALIKKLAGIGWHDLGLCRAAVRTGDR
jgi:hypothetical protein